MMKSLLATASIVAMMGCTPDIADRRGSTVKVTMTQGHGSATHIGGGFFVTAAHVVGANKDAVLKTGEGKNIPAKVLWTSTEYDIALMHGDDVDSYQRYSDDKMPHADLECRTPEYGEVVHMHGNPINLEYVTTWGRIAGNSRDVGPWGNVVPVDGALAPGMSGGGVFDDDGDMVGVVVGGMIMQSMVANGPVGIGYIVPSETLCYLLGRI